MKYAPTTQMSIASPLPKKKIPFVNRYAGGQVLVGSGRGEQETADIFESKKVNTRKEYHVGYSGS